MPIQSINARHRTEPRARARRLWRLTFAAVALTPFTLPAMAGEFPDHPIKLVVPFPPGGPTDLVSRVIAKKMSDDLGQQVVVDNRPGANGNIAGEMVSKAPADGYTVLYNTSSIALSPALYKKLPYDVKRDFAPVAMTAMVPLVLEVNAQVPVSNVAEFIAWLKANPGKMTYGSAGNGNVTHLAAFLFLQANGLDAVHAPYKGSAPALTDLAGGQVQFMTDTINSSLPFIRDKRMKALAVTSSSRSSQLPDVPTVAETVKPGFDVGAWQGMLVPAKTSPEIVKKLNAATLKALASPDVRASLAAQGAEPRGSSPEAYGKYLAQEIDRWQKVVRDSGVTLD
ncbi:Tripartite-type tricarboxylate transporter, receptor component TctC [Cupriavidus sp. YR651]|uniref:Bug family tripartite tricarboxylate transporter substrate binding protein n=1 Tax=Cupriavidus sp. YR651 TaxID=1855315 RepID=UPI000880BF4F|nr:tripartite tricarboxylate transporter substrate binding protein [Cupriavidus sp. YR651]SDC86079.1 Tripartite-type tricarboxylate transporter, receptor component TctC [Cupriavidus sp. YR651]